MSSLTSFNSSGIWPVTRLLHCLNSGICSRKVQARFFAADYATAVDASLRAQQLLYTSPSQFETAEFRFYGALSHAACWNSASPDQRQQHFEALAAHHRQLEIWAEHCPENFENRAALVGAEIARIEGRLLDAEQLYEQAIRSAHENGFVHNEAVANEARRALLRGTWFREDRALRICGTPGTAISVGEPMARYGSSIELYPHLREEKPLPDRRARSGHQSNTWISLLLSKSRKRCRARSFWKN